MIKVGYLQNLTIAKIGDRSAILREKADDRKEESAILPKRFIKDSMKVGDAIEVFVYKDNEKLMATTKKPRLTIGEVGFLKVAELAKIGAFLDNGIEKDLFLPHQEQIGELRNGGEYMVAMYVDKSGRLCATMNVYDSLKTDGRFKVGDKVKGTVFSLRRGLGAMIAVEGKYLGMILEKAILGTLHIGEKIDLQVTQVRTDGKLLLVQASKTKFRVDTQSERVYSKLIKKGGFLPFNDKASPDRIYDEFHMSKADFKKSIGALYKKRMIVITRAGIELAGRENPKTVYKNNKNMDRERKGSGNKSSNYKKGGKSSGYKKNDKSSNYRNSDKASNYKKTDRNNKATSSKNNRGRKQDR